MITLAELSKANVRAVLALDVADSQSEAYPRSNAYSIAEGMYPDDDDPVRMLAICDDGSPIGFMMISEAAERGEYFLWRMMIDAGHQRRGHGQEAMRLLIRGYKENGISGVMLLSHRESNAEAGRFYQGLGFTYTGDRLAGDDLMMQLRIG